MRPGPSHGLLMIGTAGGSLCRSSFAEASREVHADHCCFPPVPFMIEHTVRTMSGMVCLSPRKRLCTIPCGPTSNLYTVFRLGAGLVGPGGVAVQPELKSLGAEADDLDILLRSVKRHVRLPRDNVIIEADTRDGRRLCSRDEDLCLQKAGRRRAHHPLTSAPRGLSATCIGTSCGSRVCDRHYPGEAHPRAGRTREKTRFLVR